MMFPRSRWMKQILWGSVWRTFLRCGAERCLATGRGAAVGLWAPNLSQDLVNLDWLWSWKDSYNFLTMGWKVACRSFGIELPKASAMWWVCYHSCFNVDRCILWILNKNICWSHRLRSTMLNSRHHVLLFFTWCLLIEKWHLSSLPIAAPGFVGDDQQNSLWYRIMLRDELKQPGSEQTPVTASSIQRYGYHRDQKSENRCWFEHEIRCWSLLRASDSRLSNARSGSILLTHGSSEHSRVLCACT